MLITNGKLITWGEPNQILEGHAIYIEGNTIEDVGPEADLIARYPGAQRLDARGQYVMPGNICRWGEGNWTGSATEDLRPLRAGACLQDTGGRRFLVYGYFSAATPSAMARVFQAYRCRYAMHLDMNALEHTYLAVYVSQAGQLTVEHLIVGMNVLDRYAGKQFAPRFLGFPDDRDFFILTRRDGAP